MLNIVGQPVRQLWLPTEKKNRLNARNSFIFHLKTRSFGLFTYSY